MYLSLDRIDVELAAEGGGPRFLQTDHRTGDEIAARPALSTVAALTRCLNPRRGNDQVDLVYYCQHEPPQFLREAVGICGARVIVEDGVGGLTSAPEPAVPDKGKVSQLLDRAMRALALEVMTGAAEVLAIDALQGMERRFLEDEFPSEKDSIAFWGAVLELAALASAAISAAKPGSVWIYDPSATGTLPFNFRCTFRGELATVNPLGKAVKFLRGKGDGEDPSGLVAVLASSDHPDDEERGVVH